MADKSDEKAIGLDTRTADSSDSPTYEDNVTYPRQKLSAWTRYGLSAESFQRKSGNGDGDDLLVHTMKARHLQMIAIGGSIGAGFFVGSGSALNRGVCCANSCPQLSVNFKIDDLLMLQRVPALYSSIS